MCQEKSLMEHIFDIETYYERYNDLHPWGHNYEVVAFDDEVIAGHPLLTAYVVRGLGDGLYHVLILNRNKNMQKNAEYTFNSIQLMTWENKKCVHWEKLRRYSEKPSLLSMMNDKEYLDLIKNEHENEGDLYHGK